MLNNYRVNFIYFYYAIIEKEALRNVNKVTIISNDQINESFIAGFFSATSIEKNQIHYDVINNFDPTKFVR